MTYEGFGFLVFVVSLLLARRYYNREHSVYYAQVLQVDDFLMSTDKWALLTNGKWYRYPEKFRLSITCLHYGTNYNFKIINRTIVSATECTLP